MRVLLCLLVLCLCAVLPRGQAFNSTVSLTEQLYVPPGNFIGEPGVDLILNSANATGPELSLVIPPTVSTACPMLSDREASGVFFNLTRNDGLSGALGLTVHALFRQNVSTTHRRAFRDLYVCVDGAWQRSAEVNCTAPLVATTVSNASIFLQTALCHNTPFAVLQLDASKCDSDFLRYCNECIEGYYGCGCDIPSNNLYTGDDTTRMLAWLIALTFAAAATLRLVVILYGVPDEDTTLLLFKDPARPYWPEIASLLAYASWGGLAAVFIWRLYAGETGYNQTDNDMRSVTAIRLVSVLAMIFSFLMLHMLARRLKNTNACARGLTVTFFALVELIAAGYVILGPTWSAMDAHKYIGTLSPVHVSLFFLGALLVIMQALQWIWFFNRTMEQFNGSCFWHSMAIMHLALVWTVFGLMVEVNHRLPCE
jgi:hypothetical protein